MEEEDPQTYKIIGAAMTVHRELGSGFLEQVYQAALEREFIDQEIPYRREALLDVHYKGESLALSYRADFICFESIVVELKAIKALSKIEEAQIHNYLHATKNSKGLLLNFGSKSLEHRRIILSAKNSLTNPSNGSDS